MEHEQFEIGEIKRKNWLNKDNLKPLFTIEIAYVRPILGHKIDFVINI